MITEDYISFETARILKEKGFGFNNCSTYYTLHGEVCEVEKSQEIGIAPRPTLQMAMKWLREVHKLGVFPTTYYREINRNVKHDYGSTIVRLDTHEVIGNDKNIKDYTFEAETYEETAEKAIRYCLENLI